MAVGQASGATSAWGRHRGLVGVAGGQAVLLLIVGVALRDREAIAFAVLTAVGVALLRWRRGVAGQVLLGLLFIDTAAWLVPAAVDNMANHDTLRSILLPVVVASVAIVGLVTLLVDGRSASAPRMSSAVAGLLWAGLTVSALAVAGGLGVGHTTALPPGAVELSARNTQFSTTAVHVRIAAASPTTPSGTEANAAGQVTIELTNHDLFWHTFTVDKLDVDLKVPVGGSRHVTFTASPGTYAFYCAIPGHRAAGMEGTLVIEPATP